MDLTTLSDPQLYGQCKKYGSLALHYRQKFAGLLPEVYRRRLYKRRGYASIEEFAAKLAGMSHEATQKVLRLATVLEDKPCLKEQLESGRVGWSKLEKVAYVATPETDQAWAEKAANMPQLALETAVQLSRGKVTLESNVEPKKHAVTMYLSEEVEKELRAFQQTLEKESKETLDWNTVVKALLERVRGVQQSADARTQETVPASTKISLAARKEAVAQALPAEDTRYIPAKVRKLLQKEYRNSCAFPNCRKPSITIHHTKRFALHKNHDPKYLVPLCHKHNTLAHSGLIQNEEAHPTQWRLRPEPDQTSPKFRIDRLMWKFALPQTSL